jgi:penicillin-binding protein 1A
MAAAFSTLATGGIRHEPFWIRRVEDPLGRVLEEQIVRGQRSLDASIGFQVIDMMRGVLTSGTGKVVRRLGFDLPAAGKTGTSDDFRDAWFTGFTPTLSVSVWVGYDRGMSMRDVNRIGITGGRGAAPIWADFMIKATNGEPSREFTVPSDIHFETVDAVSGEVAGEWTSNRVKVALRSDQVAGAMPEQPAIQTADEPATTKADRPGTARPKQSIFEKADQSAVEETGKSVKNQAVKSTITEEDLPPE